MSGDGRWEVRGWNGGHPHTPPTPPFSFKEPGGRKCGAGGDPGRSLIERLLLRPLLSWDQHVGINPTALGPPFYLCLMVGGLEPRLVLGVIDTEEIGEPMFPPWQVLRLVASVTGRIVIVRSRNMLN